MSKIGRAAKILFALFFVAAGVNHFINPAFYENIMPPYLPWHYALVIISGVAEVVLGVGLLIPKTSRYAAWGLILLLIAIFPANLHMATHPDLYPNIPPIALWLRLPLQLLLILWAYCYTLISNRIYQSFSR